VKDVGQKQESVWSNMKQLYALKPVYHNTLILCAIWSTSSFSYYFVEFYTKFVPTTNIYLLNVIIGAADMISSMIFYLCVSRMGIKLVLYVTFFILTISSLALYLVIGITGFVDYEPGVTEISTQLSLFFAGMVFLVRCFASIGFIMAYYANTALTPPALISSVYALTNITCRFLTTGAPLVSDIVANPSIVITVLAALTFVASIFIKENTRVL